jgi:hypothetical protein
MFPSSEKKEEIDVDAVHSAIDQLETELVEVQAKMPLCSRRIIDDKHRSLGQLSSNTCQLKKN